MKEAILELDGYGAAFGDKIILTSVELKIAPRSIHVLMGPAGTGKSTLLRSLCGINYANPSFRTWGKAVYAGESLREGSAGPVMVSQNTRLLMSTVLENVVNELPERQDLTQSQQRDVAQRLLRHAGLEQLCEQLDESVVNLPLGLQRHLAIVRTTAANPRLVCIDEPTTGLDEDYSKTLLQHILREGQRRAVIVILHHQGQARSLGGTVSLLAGGWVQETAESEKFFCEPSSRAAKDFVRSGSCCVPGPDSEPDVMELAEDEPPAPPVPEEAKTYVSEVLGPRNFLWLKKGMLAGTPQPGLVTDLEYDLKALQRVGVTVLVTLLERPIDTATIKTHGIDNLWEPINDMEAPDMEQAKRLCSKVEELMRQGEVVALHCKAGLGRTGTMLAAQLIWEGTRALDALEQVRRIEPRWVQSDVQVAFLEAFAQHLNNEGAGGDKAGQAGAAADTEKGPPSQLAG